MYLKKIIMQGFKSFADKTVLEFEDGITAIVGPNGSGKSNILDALRWVMGEMSAKTLRGANMQQIIFAGTQTRKPLNFAEVSLVLDNCDRVFPIDFDELVVTRRVFRSGESVYMINNAQCRLKDVQELFMDTGIGKGGYSMIGQGNVAQILSTKAEDRREFFEGAAGVSKYKHRKEEAQRKLESANENLTRINDIVTELESQIGPLESQSKKARKYLEYYEEYKGLDLAISLITIKRSTSQLEESEAARDSVASEMDELRSREAEITGRIEELFAKAKARDDEKEEQNRRLSANEQAKMSAQNDISIARNNIKNNLQMSERIIKEIETQKLRAERMQEQIAEKTESIRLARSKSEEMTAGFADISERNNAVYQEVSAKKDSLMDLRAKLSAKREEASAKKANIDGVQKLRDEYLVRKNAVIAESEASAQDAAEIAKKIDSNEELILSTEKKRADMQKRADEAKSELEQKEVALSELLKKESEYTVNYNSMISKRRILEGMENEYEGYARSVKLVLKAPELKNRMIYGALSGLIEVDSNYVVAIETALSGALQNIVVESEDDAKAAILYLKNQKGGRATFLPVSSVKARRLDNEKEILKEPGVEGIASDLVKCDKRYRQIVENLLGRTVVCSDIDNGIALAKKFGYRFRIVTVLGEIFNAGGAISGGSVNKQSGFLSRANEIKKLGAESAELSQKISAIKAEKEKSEENIKIIRTRLDSYIPLIREYENDILLAKNTVEHLKNSMQSSGENSKGLLEEIEKLEVQLSESSEEIARLIGEQRECEHSCEKLMAQEEEMSKDLAALEAEKEAVSQQVIEETLKIRELSKDIETKEAAVKEIEENIKALGAEEKFKLDERERLLEENNELEENINELEERIEELSKNTGLIMKLMEEIDAEKQRITDEQRSIQESNKELTDRLVLLQQEFSRAENRCEKLEADRESTISRMWDEYEITPAAAEEFAAEIENEKVSAKRLSELKGKIKSLGSVNMDAIEEYKNVKQRYEFLGTQKQDLEKSRDNLNKVIDSMQEMMEEQFNKQFEQINESFKKVFSDLFGGGRGRIYLSEPENILESGIEIEAQLPGKALQNMSLYSGGERAMIATALLFAILAVKPTPFCVLDEIDAALDDVNVSRFATYLKNYLDGTQFIVITHRRGTMEAANVLYGMTMQEKGVTKMLSLAIDDVSDDMLA